jgi:crossover junction endodeoxyribonuclease RuvC
VILAEGARNKVDVCEFNPNSIKLAVTGYGKSDKKQVIEMLHKIIKIDAKKKKEIKHDDEYDAIATAITCAVSKYKG